MRSSREVVLLLRDTVRNFQDHLDAIHGLVALRRITVKRKYQHVLAYHSILPPATSLASQKRNDGLLQHQRNHPNRSVDSSSTRRIGLNIEQQHSSLGGQLRRILRPHDQFLRSRSCGFHTVCSKSQQLVEFMLLSECGCDG